MFDVGRYREVLSAYWQVDNHEHINSLSEIILGQTKAYVFFEKNYGDLHSYVRQKKRLKEEEAVRLFRQILSAVEHCHNNGIILRDLKLRKFVFKDPARCILLSAIWAHSYKCFYIFGGARCSSVVRAFAHGAMGRRIDPSWGGLVELFLVPASAPRLM